VITPLRIALAILCAAYGINPAYAECIITYESDWDVEAVGAAGEIGLAQILPDTGEWLAGLAGLEWDVDRLYDPVYNMILLMEGLSRGFDWLWHTVPLCEGVQSAGRSWVNGDNDSHTVYHRFGGYPYYSGAAYQRGNRGAA